MTKSASPDSAVSSVVGPLLQAFFVDHLYGQKRDSPETCVSLLSAHSAGWSPCSIRPAWASLHVFCPSRSN